MNEHRDASGRLTFDFFEIKSRKYSKITKFIVSKFELEPSGEFTNSLDALFQNFTKDGFVVGLEWDSWSGYIVTSKTPSSEPLTREIASCIEKEFDS